MIDAQTKVQAAHRKRYAYLYIRQSTPRQVLEHQESTQRQYGLRQQALRLGWSEEQIVVIDTDLGQSGASAADRAGFQQLVTEVSLEKEQSRAAIEVVVMEALRKISVAPRCGRPGGVAPPR